MRRNALQLTRRHKAALYFFTLLLLATGIAWWGLDRWAAVRDEFGGLAKHPAQPWMLRLHGAGAFGFLLVFGSLISGHIKRGWQARQNRATGVTLVAVFGILSLTGYALYYLGEESGREFASSAHWWIGLAAPVLLIAHVVRGHWLRRHGLLRKSRNPAPREAEGSGLL